MLHHLVFANGGVLAALDLAPEHLCVGLMLLHMTAKVRLTSNMGAAFCADHAGLGGSCGVGYVRFLSNSMGCWWCSNRRLAVAITIGAVARNAGRKKPLGEGAFANDSDDT